MKKKSISAAESSFGGLSVYVCVLCKSKDFFIHALRCTACTTTNLLEVRTTVDVDVHSYSQKININEI